MINFLYKINNLRTFLKIEVGCMGFVGCMMIKNILKDFALALISSNPCPNTYFVCKHLVVCFVNSFFK